MGDLKLKTHWKGGHANSWQFLCPQCKTNRKVPFRARIGDVRDWIRVGLLSVVFTLLTYPLWKWRGIVSFVFFWAIFETTYRLRRRVALVCPYCGFDPVLFLRDSQKARQEVQAFWRKRFEEKGLPFPEEGMTPPGKKANPSGKEKESKQA